MCGPSLHEAGGLARTRQTMLPGQARKHPGSRSQEAVKHTRMALSWREAPRPRPRSSRSTVRQRAHVLSRAGCSARFGGTMARSLAGSKGGARAMMLPPAVAAFCGSLLCSPSRHCAASVPRALLAPPLPSALPVAFQSLSHHHFPLQLANSQDAVSRSL